MKVPIAQVNPTKMTTRRRGLSDEVAAKRKAAMRAAKS